MYFRGNRIFALQFHFTALQEQPKLDIDRLREINRTVVGHSKMLFLSAYKNHPLSFIDSRWLLFICNRVEIESFYLAQPLFE